MYYHLKLLAICSLGYNISPLRKMLGPHARDPGSATDKMIVMSDNACVDSSIFYATDTVSCVRYFGNNPNYITLPWQPHAVTLHTGPL